MNEQRNGRSESQLAPTRRAFKVAKLRVRDCSENYTDTSNTNLMGLLQALLADQFIVYATERTRGSAQEAVRVKGAAQSSETEEQNVPLASKKLKVLALLSDLSIAEDVLSEP